MNNCVQFSSTANFWQARLPQWRPHQWCAAASRGVVPGGAGGATALPDFGRSVNPISTRGTDYAHLITTGTPRFFRPYDGPDAAAALYSSKSRQGLGLGGLASRGGFGVESTSQVAETIKFLP